MKKMYLIATFIFSVYYLPTSKYVLIMNRKFKQWLSTILPITT